MNGIFHKINRAQKISFAVGILFLILSALGAALNPKSFFVSWLIAFIFWIGLSLGCLNIAMIHYLTRSHWGNVTVRFIEAGFMTLPLMAIFFIPILFGLPDLYPWARPEQVAADKILQQKIHYENFDGFLLRAIFYFTIWILIAARLRKWSLQMNAENNFSSRIKLKTLSGPGVVIVPLLATFAFVDWIMSIEPAWFSTIFSVIILSAEILLAFAFVIILLAWLCRQNPFQNVVSEKHFHDLGNLLLAFVMFWTYVAFSQFLIIYSGNQPHEIGWYLRRIAGGWKFLVGGIAAFHFFAPFFLLLFRDVKKNVRALAAIAILIFFVDAIEIFWTIAPTFYPGLKIHFTDFTAWLGLGGIWLAIFFANLKRQPLVAPSDKQLEISTPEVADA